MCRLMRLYLLRGGGTLSTAGGKGATRCKEAKKHRRKVGLKTLGYYGAMALRSIVTLFPLLEDGLMERVLLEIRKQRRYESRLFRVTNPFLSLLWKDKRMGNNQYPHQPSLIKDGNTYVAHSYNIRRVAFTLAEILITLGIIGVIAALTIPALINNTQNRELQAALKKGYSQLAQALELMKSDLGEDILPQNYPAGTFKPIYCKYFKSLKNGLILGGKPDEDTGGNAMVFENYKTYNLSQTVKTVFFDDGQFILSDGTLIMIENPGGMSARQIYITIDVNGMNKKPNVYGRDLFTFQITNEGKFLPMGAPGTGFTDENLYCSKDSNNRLNGIGCAAKALSDPDYFKKY